MSPVEDLEYGFFGSLLDFESGSVNVRISSAFQEGADESWFSIDECRLVWLAVDKCWKSSEQKTPISSIDIIFSANELAKDKKSPFAGMAVSYEFFEKASSLKATQTDVASYAKILRKKSVERKSLERLKKIQTEFQESADPTRVLAELTRDLTKIQSEGSNVQELSMTEITDSVLTTFDTAYDQYVVKKNYDYVSGIPLPWRPLSRAVSGLQSGVTIIAARPSVGKSSFVLFILQYMAEHGYKCAFNCIDMSATMISQRPFATITGIPLNELRSGYTGYREDRDKILDAKSLLVKWDAESRLKMLHKNDVDDFKAWCIMRKEQGLLDVVAIDYVQMMSARGRFSSSNEKLEYISGQLKDLATQYDLPVIVLSQLSRDNVKDKNGEREPQLSDLRGSGALEQDAFMVMLLSTDNGTMNAWSENVPHQIAPGFTDDRKKAVKPVWCNIAKNQNGDHGRFPFIVYQDTFTWFLADKKAEKLPSGATNMNKFLRVHPDWRRSDLEIAIENAGGLIPGIPTARHQLPPDPFI